VIARSINVADSIGDAMKALLAHPDIATEKHRDSVTRIDRSKWQYILDLVSFDEDVIVAYGWSQWLNRMVRFKRLSGKQLEKGPDDRASLFLSAHPWLMCAARQDRLANPKYWNSIRKNWSQLN